MGWSDEQITDFYRYRFGGGSREWIKNGIWGLKADDRYGDNYVRFWAFVKSRASELLGIRTKPPALRIDASSQ